MKINLGVQQNNSFINLQVYLVAQYFNSNAIVDANAQVSFKASNYIELVDDFEVILGAEFEAAIDGCQ